MLTHTVGIIGYGGFGQFLHQAWAKIPEVQITAVADQNPDNAPSGEIRFYQDWDDLLKDREVDVVSIATPPSTHVEIACAAMEAGKHVLIEKPIASDLAGAHRILQVQKQTGRVASVNFMLRFNPLVAALAILTKDSVFGQLRRVDVENYAQDQVLPASHWFWNPQVSGGILLEHAVHFIDLVHFLSPQPYLWVAGASHRRNEAQEDIVMANAGYQDGLMATHYHSFTRPGFFENTTIRLSFDLAQIDLQGWVPLTGTISALVNDETKTKVGLIPGLMIGEIIDIHKAEDFSRPEGWGKTASGTSTNRALYFRGTPHTVTDILTGSFGLGRQKHQVYADCVRAVLIDLTKKVSHPEHQLRITLEDGFKSLEIAALATDSARSKGAEAQQ